MTQKIILIRHGESQKNKEDPLRRLTVLGIKEIRQTAKRIQPLVENKKCRIVSTSTPRATESAQILSQELGIKFNNSFADLRVENIKELTTKRNGLTWEYFQAFKEKRLPKQIPPPNVIAKRFLEAASKFKKQEILIFIGHSGALEAFALFQKKFEPTTKLKKELEYGEHIILEKCKKDQ